MHQIRFAPGLHPDPTGPGSSWRSPRPHSRMGRGSPLPIPLPLDAFSVSVPAPSVPFALHPNFFRSCAARRSLPISWFTDSSQMCLNDNILYFRYELLVTTAWLKVCDVLKLCLFCNCTSVWLYWRTTFPQVSGLRIHSQSSVSSWRRFFFGHATAYTDWLRIIPYCTVPLQQFYCDSVT